MSEARGRHSVERLNGRSEQLWEDDDRTVSHGPSWLASCLPGNLPSPWAAEASWTQSPVRPAQGCRGRWHLTPRAQLFTHEAPGVSLATVSMAAFAEITRTA